MAHKLPTEVRNAIDDPKGATLNSLVTALSYVDSIAPHKFDMLVEEHGRRGGDYEMSTGYYDAPEYY